MPFDRARCRTIREEGERILTEHFRVQGVHVEFKGGKFNRHNYTVKIEFSDIEADGMPTTTEAVNFAQKCHRFGLRPDDLGKEFTGMDGKRYKITGLKPRSPRYPILADRQPDGKGFKFPAFLVKEAMNRERQD